MLKQSHFAIVRPRWQLTKRSRDKMSRHWHFLMRFAHHCCSSKWRKACFHLNAPLYIYNIPAAQTFVSRLYSLHNTSTLTAITKRGHAEKVYHLTFLHWNKTSHLKSSSLDRCENPVASLWASVLTNSPRFCSLRLFELPSSTTAIGKTDENLAFLFAPLLQCVTGKRQKMEGRLGDVCAAESRHPDMFTVTAL